MLKTKILFCIFCVNLFFIKLSEKCDLILKPYAALSIPIHINKKLQASSDQDRDTCNKYLDTTWKKLIETSRIKIKQSVDSRGFLNIFFKIFITKNPRGLSYFSFNTKTTYSGCPKLSLKTPWLFWSMNLIWFTAHLPV